VVSGFRSGAADLQESFVSPVFGDFFLYVFASGFLQTEAFVSLGFQQSTNRITETITQSQANQSP
jgi:hypothetical protein